ncbi:MAG: hypothetical protein QXZ60_00395 [Sulfolobales archaeon]
MWFAHVTGPLGTYVRVRWMYVVDIEDCSKVSDLAGSQSSLLNLSKSRVDEIMIISSLDPDLVDIFKTSEKDHVCVYLYGR